MHLTSRAGLLWSAAAALTALVALAANAVAWPGNVKVWDTSGLAGLPAESEVDEAGLTRHGTSAPTIATTFAAGALPNGASGLMYWNPETNLFVFYGRAVGFPSSIDVNRSGPVTAGGPFGSSFGPGDVWVGGQQNKPLYVHIAGTDLFRAYGTNNPVLPPTSKVWGVAVDQTTGDVFVAQPWEGRVTRIHPADSMATAWQMQASCNGTSCGNPMYVALDAAGRPYATTANSTFGDAIMRINPGLDGVLGTADDTITFWPLPSSPGAFVQFNTLSNVVLQQNPDDIVIDSDGNIWFTESNANKIGRLNAATNAICEFTTDGLHNPQQVVTAGSGNLLQAYLTEGEGNAVSILTQVEADLAGSPTRVCTTVTPITEPVPIISVVAETLDEQALPITMSITPTTFTVSGVGTGGSGTTKTASGDTIPPFMRFTPMPNPIVLGGSIVGDGGNGFPAGLTRVYSGNRVAGDYLKTSKVFQFENPVIIAP